MINETLANRAVQLGRQHPPRTPGRRSAGMVYAALITTRTPGAARRALGTFGEPAHRTAAVRLLDELQQESSA
jgi:hypothetical protein